MTERKGPNFVTATTAVQLKLKKVIVKDILSGIAKIDTFRKLRSVILAFSAKITDKELRETFETSLAKNCVKIYDDFYEQVMSIGAALGYPLAALLYKEQSKSKRAKGATFPQPVADDHYLPLSPPDEIVEGRLELPNYHKKVKAEIARLVKELADKDMKAPSGAVLRNIAEIQVRHAAQLESIDEMKRLGIKLVWASTHLDCSKRCFKWQGRLYSLDDTYGTTDTGVSYIPLSVAVDVYYTTRSGKTYKNGLLGFNCRHRLIPYKDEQNPPKCYTRAQTAAAYALDQQQRALERQIRKVKERAFLLRASGAAQKGEVQKLFANARKMTADYRKFCEKNNRVAMIYRTQVTTEEINYNRRRQRGER